MATGHQRNVYTGMLATGASRTEIREALRDGALTPSQAKVLESQTKK